MMYSEVDVIAAPATPIGVRAPLAMIRVSGDGCWDMIQKLFRSKQSLSPWSVVYGNWYDDAGLLDDVTVMAYEAPRSYTGQDMLEITCHGNPLIVDQIMKSLVRQGMRRARPGEFTMRAVYNGKMDLLQAEAVSGIIEANTRYQADLARRQSKGPIVEFVNNQVEQILQIQAHIEATIDYGEEDIDAVDRSGLLGKMDGLLTAFNNLRETGRFANAMKRGFRVLLTGAPNVGKSTLFNRLVKEERAIVTPIAGTTRDLVHEDLEIRGLPVVLIDSAGVRDTDDVVESMGIQKIYELLEEVDLVLYLSEALRDEPPYEQLAELPKEKWIHVLTKVDLEKGADDGKIAVSAVTGEGLDRLEDELVIRLSSAMDGQSVYLINQRQEELISEVIEQLDIARGIYAQGFGEEVLSSYLNTARRALGELTGETSVEDILDRMFSNFCLGK